MAARRYIELCDHVCAIIFSHRSAVRYFQKSRTCPFLDIARENPLPPGSLSARGRSQPGYLSEWKETPPEIWFGASRRLTGKVIYEQFLDQQDGYRLTMLMIDDIPDQDQPHEDQISKRAGPFASAGSTPIYWRLIV
jgi:hypothetical protein